MREQLCMVVYNQPNVLVRVFRLFARYGLSIYSLSVKISEQSEYLEITLTTDDESVSQQLIRMLHKLIDVVDVKLACE